MSKKAKTALKISVIGLAALFCTDFLYMADLTFYPSFGVLMGAFYEFDPTTMTDNMAILNFSMTGSQLAAMIASFIVIPLMRVFTKKTMLLWETAIFAVFALCTPLVDNVVYVAAMRTLSGLGFGGLLTTAIALIQQIFRDSPKRRDMLVGWFNGFLGLSGAVMSLAGGFLAAISWSAIYNMYWIAVPIFLLILFFVPRTPADKDDAVDEEVAEELVKEGEGGWDGSFPKVVAAAVSFFVISVIYLAMGSGQMALWIPELGLGGEVETGIVTTVANLCSFFAGLIFAIIFHKVRRFFSVILFALLAIGLAIYCTMPASIVLVAIAFGLAACSYSMGMSYYMVYVSEVAPASKASTAIAIITIGLTAGSFASPFVVTWLQGLLGAPLLDPEMGAFALGPLYPVFLVVTLIGLVLSIVLAIRSRKNGEKIGEEPQEEAQQAA